MSAAVARGGNATLVQSDTTRPMIPADLFQRARVFALETGSG